jgi:NADP-dependent 3-hydroxy acid dehydrogenase YdfG
MNTGGSTLGELCDAVPKGRAELDYEELRILSKLTRRLIGERQDAAAEYRRFKAIAQRTLDLPAEATRAWIEGRTVLVTGGTGCIGTLVAEQVAANAPGRLVCVARGVTKRSRNVEGAEYKHVDVCDMEGLRALFAGTRPDVVIHLAAQRDPGLAEVEVHRTLMTNVFGTRNVLAASAEQNVPDVVITSTGKALRPYSPDVYAASKRVAEWLSARAAAESGKTQGTRISATRFTHVVDNSIIAQRLRRWCDSGVIRLHGAHIEFYVQSGIEAAQLLLAAGLDAAPNVLRINALRDLSWPVGLLEVALGTLAETDSASPIYICGHEDGYESTPFPALYDPVTAGDVSPLINAFEAPAVRPGICDAVDRFDAPALREDQEVLDRLQRLEKLCAQTTEPEALRSEFDALSRALLEATLRDLPDAAVARALHFADRTPHPLAPTHAPVVAALRQRLQNPAT